MLSEQRIREIMLSHGFKIKEGQTDLMPYVYGAARAIEDEVRNEMSSEAKTRLEVRDNETTAETMARVLDGLGWRSVDGLLRRSADELRRLSAFEKAVLSARPGAYVSHFNGRVGARCIPSALEAVPDGTTLYLLDLPSSKKVQELLCQACNGQGEVVVSTNHLGPDDYEFLTTCPACNGTGSDDIREAINSLGFWEHKTDVTRVVISRTDVLRVIEAREAASKSPAPIPMGKAKNRYCSLGMCLATDPEHEEGCDNHKSPV